MGALAFGGSLLAACQPAVPAAPPNPTAKPAAQQPAAQPKATVAPAVSTGAGGPEVKSLKVGILPIAALTPPVVTKKLGYFQEEGFTDVEFTPLGGGAELLPAVEAGRLDLALSAYYSVFLAREQGFDFWVVTNNDSATAGPTDGYAVIVKADSPIKTVKDLEGKRVATNTVPSLGMGYLSALMKKEGADYKKVSFSELPFGQMPDAVAAGQVDAATTLEPSTTVALTSGKSRALAYPYVALTPNVDLGGFIGTQKWLKQNPITAERFERALSRGMAYMKDDATARKEIAEFTKIDPAVLAKMTLPVWRTRADPKKVQVTADMMVDLGVLKQKLDVSSFFARTALA